MAKQSAQKFIARNRAPRVQIEYDVEVYGAEKDGSGMPRVAMGYEVRRPDGSVFRSVAPAEILPTSLGHLSRLFRFSLHEAEPGDYELVMDFRDRISGKSLEVKEPFSVLGPAPAEQASARPGSQ